MLGCGAQCSVEMVGHGRDVGAIKLVSHSKIECGRLEADPGGPDGLIGGVMAGLGQDGCDQSGHRRL